MNIKKLFIQKIYVRKNRTYINVFILIFYLHTYVRTYHPVRSCFLNFWCCFPILTKTSTVLKYTYACSQNHFFVKLADLVSKMVDDPIVRMTTGSSAPQGKFELPLFTIVPFSHHLSNAAFIFLFHQLLSILLHQFGRSGTECISIYRDHC